MAVALLFKKQLAQIDSLVLDASVSESHTVEVQITDHPVEQGVDVTDHRRRKPRQLTIEGIVSNTPLPQVSDPTTLVTVGNVTFQSLSAGSTADTVPALNAYQTLLALADSPKLITVITALQTYENMTLSNLSVPRDASVGQSLHFTATLREIKLVRNDVAQVSANTTRANGLVDQHKKTKTTSKVDNRTTALIIQEDGIQAASKHLIDSLLPGAGQ